MKYLMIVGFLLLAGCDCEINAKPDFYICPSEIQKDMSAFTFKCEQEGYGISGCVEKAKIIYCKPGYRPKNVEKCNCPGTETELKSVVEEQTTQDW